MSAEEYAAYRPKYVIPESEKAFGALTGTDADDYRQESLMYKELTCGDNRHEYLKTETYRCKLPQFMRICS